MNVWAGTGRLVRDPELQYSKDGKAWTKITVAINRRFNKEKTDFIPCTAFGKTAEFLCSYGSKGRLVEVTGSVQIDNYTDKEGNKRTSTDIMVDNASFLDKQQSQGYEADPLGQAGQADSWDDVGKGREQDEEPY